MALFLFLFFIFLFYNFYWKRRNLPPGPVPLPLVGNLHSIAGDPPGYGVFKKWHKKYGKICTYFISERPIISISDFEMIQEYFVKDGDTFSGRTTLGKFNDFIRRGDYGIVFTEGEMWKEHRRFALTVFRDLGMSRPIMEQKILLEQGYFFDMIKEELSENSKKGTNVNLIPMVEVTIANIINQMLFGFSYHEKEEIKKFSEWKDLISDHMRTGISPLILTALEYPEIFRHIPYFKEELQRYREQYCRLTSYCFEQIKKHKKKFSENPILEPSDFVDYYLKEIEKKNFKTFDEKQLTNFLYDAFIAGQETTANTVIYGIIFSLNFPETQKKLQIELDTVIGSDRQITVADRPDLVYCQAFINETLRLTNLLPQNLFHKNLKDVVIGGYRIKKGSTVIPQISCVLFNEEIFPNPMTFEPGRFIDEKGRLKKIEEFIPFSVGKRQCLGESLARTELHLLISNFFNNFKVTPNEKLPSMEKIPGITVQPYPFTCNIEKRF